jgi:hypothetical protein
MKTSHMCFCVSCYILTHMEMYSIFHPILDSFIRWFPNIYRSKPHDFPTCHRFNPNFYWWDPTEGQHGSPLRKKTASKLLCEKINVYMGLWAYCIQKLELPINLRFIPSSSAVKSNPVQWLNPQHGPPSIRHFSLPVSLKGNPKS